MTSESTQASAPDLSHLPYETRVRIAVAGTQGWRYRAQSRFDPSIPIGIPPRGAGGVKRDSRGNVALPNYLHDPAAWGALLEKEGMSVGSRFKWHRGIATGLLGWASDHHELEADRDRHQTSQGGRSPGEAVCRAVLAKHGITVNPEPS